MSSDHYRFLPRALTALAGALLTFAAHADQWIVVDGQAIQVADQAPVRIGQVLADGTRLQYPSLKSDPQDTVPTIRRQTDRFGPKHVLDALRLPSVVDTAIYEMDAARNSAARKEATDRLIKKMTETGEKFGLGGVVADGPPPTTLSPTDAIAAGKGWGRNYQAVDPTTSNSDMELYGSVFHAEPELRPPNPGDGPEIIPPGYFHRVGGIMLPDDEIAMAAGQRSLSGLLVGERDDAGKIVVRQVDERDGLRYQQYEADRKAAEAAERQKAAQEAADAAKKAAEAADDARRAAAVKAAKEAEDAKKQADDEAAAAKKAADDRRRRIEERDSSCSRGGADCAYVDSQLTNDFERAERFNRTAHCMQFDEGHPAPRGGPCSGGAAPCIYCNTINSLNRERLISDRLKALFRGVHVATP
jgi:nucleoid-associated protein YgaU